MKTVIVLSCIVLGITAYNFDDAVFNQFLANDFESLAEDTELVHSRARRLAPPTEDAKCHHKHSHLCCGAKEIEEYRSAQRDTKKECFKEVTGRETFHGKPFDPFDCADIEKRKKEMICVESCVGKKIGVTDDNGNLNEAKLKKHVTDNNKFEWIKPKLDEILTKCIAEAKEAAKETKKEEGACNPAVLKFTHCLFREEQMQCPDDQIEDAKKCEIVRGILNHSKFFVPHH